jgi:hypothetical protein
VHGFRRSRYGFARHSSRSNGGGEGFIQPIAPRTLYAPDGPVVGPWRAGSRARTPKA